MASERASQHAFFGVSALLFAASAALTIVWCESMSAMGEMPMPGGWTLIARWKMSDVVTHLRKTVKVTSTVARCDACLKPHVVYSLT